MHKLIYDDQERLLQWACERIGIARFREDAVAIGSACGEELKAVSVFDTFTAVDCCMSIASDGSGHWLTRGFLVASFAYPFIQCDMRRISSFVSVNNKRAIKFDEHIGWVREGLHRKASLGGEDLISMGMLRSECRFIPQRYRHD